MSARIDGSSLLQTIQDAFEDLFLGDAHGPASSTGTAVEDGDPSDVDALFRQQFGDLAQDRDAFHATMRQIYGDSYDVAAAEDMRQKALTGDFSWLPPAVYVGSDVLGGANGAYDAEAGVVYLNESLLSDPALAASTFVEEAGHHIDTLLNATDSAGDEGELFRRILSGEDLSASQIASIQAENDHGTITIDGRQVDVEFWNPFKAVASAVSSVVDAVGGVISDVGEAVGNAVSGVVDGLKSVGETVFGTVTGFFGGLGQGILNFGKSLIQGDLTGALENLYHGLDKAFLQTPAKLFQGMLNAAEEVANGVTELLGPLGGPARELIARGTDIVRSVWQATEGVVRDAVGLVVETPLGFLGDLGHAAGELLKGNFGEAGKAFLGAFGNAAVRAVGGAVDMLVRAGHGVADILGTGLFLQPPSRGLSDDEKDYLRSIYGDSIDVDSIRIRQGGPTEWFGAAPHTVGNTIYMREAYPLDNFNDDGTLTDEGMVLLAHEAAHVWQNQNGGGDYLHESLASQAWGAITGGSRNAAYEWDDAFDAGVPFADMNPEQQAEIIEEVARYILVSGSTDPSAWSTSRSADELAFLVDAWRQVQAGFGAP